MSKKGVSKISGPTKPKIGEKAVYKVIEWYPATPLVDRDPRKVTWELFRKRENGKFTTTNIKKKGVGEFTFNPKAVNFTYKVEGYLHNSEGKEPMAIQVHPQKNEQSAPKVKEKEILGITLTHIDGSAITKALSYMDRLKVVAKCQNMSGEKLVFKLWEDDKKGIGHNKGNEYIAKSKDIIVDSKGYARTEFTLFNTYIQLANKNEDDTKTHEYYVMVEYNGKHNASKNVNVNNPEHKKQSTQKPKPQPESTKGSTNTNSKNNQPDKKGNISSIKLLNAKKTTITKATFGDIIYVQIKGNDLNQKKYILKIWEDDTFGDNDLLYKGEHIFSTNTYQEVKVILTDEYRKVGEKGNDLKNPDTGEYTTGNYQEIFAEVELLTQVVKSSIIEVSLKAKQKSPENKKSVNTVNKQPVKKQETNCVCKQYDLIWGKSFTCEERLKIIEISKRLNCNPNYLTSAMALETGGTFDPSKVNSLGYTGLIQIGADAAADINRRKGTKISSGNSGNLKNMTKLEQLTYVEYYLEPFKGKLNTLADFYLAILMPVDCGKGNLLNHVVFDRNLLLDYKDGKVIKNTKWVRQRAYNQNPVFHKEGNKEDGKTYVWEISEEIKKWHKKGLSNLVSEFSCQEKLKDEPKKQTNNKWHDPVDNPRLTKYNYSGIIKPSSGTFGECRRNEDGTKKYHGGFDFFAIPGKDKVYSCLKGNIVEVRFSDNAGWIIRVKVKNIKDLLDQEKKINYTIQYTDEWKGRDIKETDDAYLIYMHLDSVLFSSTDAKNNKEIESGTPLGYAGVSGSVANKGRAPHLHMEIATVKDPYNEGRQFRTNPARFVKLNSYDTKDQDEAAKIIHKYKKK